MSCNLFILLAPRSHLIFFAFVTFPGVIRRYVRFVANDERTVPRVLEWHERCCTSYGTAFIIITSLKQIVYSPYTRRCVHVWTGAALQQNKYPRTFCVDLAIAFDSVCYPPPATSQGLIAKCLLNYANTWMLDKHLQMHLYSALINIHK